LLQGTRSAVAACLPEVRAIGAHPNLIKYYVEVEKTRQHATESHSVHFASDASSML